MEVGQSPKLALNLDRVRVDEPQSPLNRSSAGSSQQNTARPADVEVNAPSSHRSSVSINTGEARDSGTNEKHKLYDAIPYDLQSVTFPEKSPSDIHQANVAGRANKYGDQSIQGGPSRFSVINIFREATSICRPQVDSEPAINVPPHPAISAELNRNLEIGIRTARTVSQLIPKVNNPMEAGNPYIISDPQTTNPVAAPTVSAANYADYETYKAMLDDIRSSRSESESLEALTARIAAKHGVGNCGEQAATAYISLINEGVSRVDFMRMSATGVRDGMLPHALVVIDRQTGTDQSNDEGIGSPDTWNSTAVICDPWSRTAFPAHDYEAFYDRIIDYADQRASQLQFSVMARHTS